jgi:hypothetical protein
LTQFGLFHLVVLGVVGRRRDGTAGRDRQYSGHQHLIGGFSQLGVGKQEMYLQVDSTVFDGSNCASVHWGIEEEEEQEQEQERWHACSLA